MSENTPSTNQPYGGVNDPTAEEGLPGERPDDSGVQPPESAGRDDETASRAATDDEMTSQAEQGFLAPGAGIPEQVDAPSPADATEGDPPGGSAANQTGRTPDR